MPTEKTVTPLCTACGCLTEPLQVERLDVDLVPIPLVGIGFCLNCEAVIDSKGRRVESAASHA